LRRADGRDDPDLSLGDRGALLGHAPAAVAEAIAATDADAGRHNAVFSEFAEALMG
jgi:glutamate-1-semialdehyde aminotransferase